MDVDRFQEERAGSLRLLYSGRYDAAWPRTVRVTRVSRMRDLKARGVSLPDTSVQNAAPDSTRELVTKGRASIRAGEPSSGARGRRLARPECLNRDVSLGRWEGESRPEVEL
jgi:hypothetical protein